MQIRTSPIGKLDKAWGEAKTKADWKRVFPFEP